MTDDKEREDEPLEEMPVTEKASIIKDYNGKEIEDKIDYVQELSVTNTASDYHETCKLCCSYPICFKVI